MRALVLVLLGSTTVAHAECPDVKQVALAYAEGATSDELLGFHAAMLTRVHDHCSADARAKGRAFNADAAACFRKATTAAAARACIDRQPNGLRASLDAAAADAFPYTFAVRRGALEFHGPFPLTVPSRALDDMARFLNANPTLKIEVNAFADDIGGPARRRAESMQRATDVRAYLVKAGVDAARVTASARGVERPKADERHVIFLVKSGTVAVAVPPPPAPPPPPASGATPGERARLYYAQGESEYNLGNYDKAIASFEAAYREVPSAALLFNVGQAYKQKGDKANAIASFEAYLKESPSSSNASRVRQMIDDLRKQP